MRALLDACVLYPTVMREILLAAAEEGLYEPRWSERILEEWARAYGREGAGAELLARGEIAALRGRFPLAVIPQAPGLEARLWLPDPADIHVLASAVAGSCDLIVTINASDFPRNLLEEQGLERLDPDQFLMTFWRKDSAAVGRAVAQVHARAEALSGENWPIRGLLKKARLPRLGKAMDPGGTKPLS